MNLWIEIINSIKHKSCNPKAVSAEYFSINFAEIPKTMLTMSNVKPEIVLKKCSIFSIQFSI